jgi:hypothetical protein
MEPTAETRRRSTGSASRSSGWCQIKRNFWIDNNNGGGEEERRRGRSEQLTSTT